MPPELDAHLAAMAASPPDVLIVGPNALLRLRQAEIIAFAERAKVPTIYGASDYVDAGGLMSYGPHRAALGRRPPRMSRRSPEGLIPRSFRWRSPRRSLWCSTKNGAQHRRDASGSARRSGQSGDRVGLLEDAHLAHDAAADDLASAAEEFRGDAQPRLAGLRRTMTFPLPSHDTQKCRASIGDLLYFTVRL